MAQPAHRLVTPSRAPQVVPRPARQSPARTSPAPEQPARRPPLLRRDGSSRRDIKQHGLQKRTAAAATMAPPRRIRIVDRPMVRATAHLDAPPRPVLTVVPRRRRAARLVVVLCAFIVTAMAGAAAFQTLLAKRQLEIDKTEQAIEDAREQYEQLRRERAELRSPGRLAELAGGMDMVAAQESSFMTIDPAVMAVVQSSSGRLGGDDVVTETDPLAQFRVVKGVAWGPR